MFIYTVEFYSALYSFYVYIYTIKYKYYINYKVNLFRSIYGLYGQLIEEE